MLIIADKRIPAKAKKSLAVYGEVIPFSTHGITYPAISCHPDIFLCKMNDDLIVAPNLPGEYKMIFQNYAVNFIEGEAAVGNKQWIEQAPGGAGQFSSGWAADSH